jgi:hypothetical protein
MEEKQQKCDAASCLRGAVPFALGLAAALIFGWGLFPGLLYSDKSQPVAFSHASHTEGAGLSCADCHFLREDGSFSGLPRTEYCASCHASAMGESKAEREYVEKYVDTGLEAPWLVHQKQPDNVFFSHAAHSPAACASCHADYDPEDESNAPDALCSVCHLPLSELDKGLAYKENRLTGYSKSTMKMWQCEKCHARPEHLSGTNSNNACYTCHK